MQWLFIEVRDSDGVKEANKWLSPPWWRQPGPDNNRKTLSNHRSEGQGEERVLPGPSEGWEHELATVRDRVQKQKETVKKQPTLPPFPHSSAMTVAPISHCSSQESASWGQKAEWTINVCQEGVKKENKQHILLSELQFPHL